MLHAVPEEGRSRRPSSFSYAGAKRWFDTARAASRLSAPAALALALFPVVIVPSFAWFLALRETHVGTYMLLMENGVVELLTFATFLTASVLAFVYAHRLARRAAPPLEPRFFRLLGVVAFVGAGEESAWGQSFLNFATPWAVREINDQGELTIHNLRGLQDLNAFLLLAIGLAACGALWARRSPRWRPIAAPSLLAPYALSITLSGAMCFAVDVFYFGKTFDLLVGMLSEVVELLMAVFLLLYVALNARGATHGRRGAD